jgi:GNAT superfamily N-acetyltransferase
VVSALPDAVIRAWATARSIARELPLPVADHGGWRVDTRSAEEECRYFFAAPLPEIALLAATITRPRVLIKLCESRDVLERLVPAGWVFEVDTWVMEGAPLAHASLPTGYHVERQHDRKRLAVRLIASDGSVAASGYGASALGVFAYDRIVTDERHRRRGLGRALMALLGEGASPSDRHVLVATAAGRALYESIGWCVRSDYTTAFIPAGA